MCKKLWQQLALATFLAAGLALLWGGLAAWGIGTYESRRFGGQPYEDLAVDARGDAWIQVHRGYLPGTLVRRQNQLPYRTLDGEPIDVPLHDFWISGCSLPIPNSDWVAGQIENNWNMRVRRVAETDREYWYLVHNGSDDAGKAYLVGYDLLTKLPVGYCGRQGFRGELPGEDQWFPMDGRSMAYGLGSYAVTSTRKDPRISLATQNGWFEFDVRQRAFRAIDESRSYLSVGICKVPQTLPEDIRDKLNGDENETLNTQVENFSPGWPEVFAARQQDRIIVSSAQQAEPLEFTIPEEYQDRSINFYLISADQALLETSQGLGVHRKSYLLWTNAAGEIQKSKPIVWSRRRQSTNLEGFSILSMAMPIPLAVFVVTTGLITFSQRMPEYANWQDAGYFERLGMIAADVWLPLLALVIVAAGLTWIMRRWHWQYSRPNLGAWVALVFLLGVPGFVAYWAYHKRPPMEACPECGNRVPRNRDACAHCEQPFPESSLLGTEVFA